MAGLLAWIGAGGPPLTAVLHTAGVVDDGPCWTGSTRARLAAVLAAKAAGAAHLDELTAGLDLDAFVLFSSAAATLGGAGQGELRGGERVPGRAGPAPARAAGLPATSVAWGPWAGGGMAQASQAVRQRLRRGALPAMDPALAVRRWARCSTAAKRLLAVMDVDWARFAAASRCAAQPAARDLPEVRQALAPRDAGTGAGADRGRALRQAAGGLAAGRAGPDADRPGPGRGRRGARPLLRRGGRGGPGVQRPGVRLADRGGTAEPARTPRPGCGCPPPWCSTTRPRRCWPSTCGPDNYPGRAAHRCRCSPNSTSSSPCFPSIAAE